MKRELIVTTEGRDRNVIVDGPLPDGRFRVSIDGTEQLVDARAIRPGTWSLVIARSGLPDRAASPDGGAESIAGRNFVVDLDRRRTGIAASVGASEVLLTVDDALKRRLAAAAGPRVHPTGELIKAPIAGKVVKLLVAIGDVVAPGTAVIVLEAMKMENELIAERGGTVAALHKQAGQAVDTGDLLAELT